MARKFAGPIAIIVDNPMANIMEYRPPIQSQNSNMFAVSIPNLATFHGVGRDGNEMPGD
jgi:hypothetical protein